MHWLSRTSFLIVCVGTILVAAASTFFYLTINPHSGRYPFIGWVVLSFLFAPIFGLVVARWGGRAMMMATSLHLGAVSGAFVVLMGVASYKNTLYGVDLIFACVLLAMLFPEVLGLLSAAKKSTDPNRSYDALGAALSFGSSIVAGCVIGTMMWSRSMPTRVLAAAQALAQGQPYCIQTTNGVVRRSEELNGLAMLANTSSGMAWNFHALLIVDGIQGREYANWSYRRGTFMPVTEGTLHNICFHFQTACRPTQRCSEQRGDSEPE